MKFSTAKLARTIGWRPIVSYFLLIFVFFALLKLYPVTRENAFGVALLSLPFAVLLAWIMLKRVIFPLNLIAEAAQEMARGNLEKEIKIYTNDEIGDLARSINLLASRLKHTVEDITDEKNRMHAILNSMADGVVAVDSAGRVLLVNPVVERALGISGQASRGKEIVEVVRHYDFEKYLKEALVNQLDLRREIQVLTPDPKIYSVHFTPLKGSDRGGVVALFRDVTEKRQLEQLRNEFIANVSHELRTPMTSIKGFLETLLDGALDDRDAAEHFLKIMSAETERLTRLIDDLFALSNIENRKVLPKKEPILLEDVVEKVVSILGQSASDKDIELTTSMAEDLPRVMADEDMITRVIINLLDNAIKYTHTGGRISVEAGRDGERIFVRVTDTGIGIPEESLSRVFERLYRVDRARSRECGGTGLGLAIVKHILEVHGGSIEVTSSLGRGSTFTAYLPL
ncbi:phosphate regulon sensor protein PhoR [Desulfocucumis palustris]|uniref:histidine kinase n=1 Tax=Desulfocucumis palustris TaxID=1898651 RepID=A0A2L2X9R4_9FIRM|nr:HAMP domain-containing sensor histidine kinase [Desulfocucumis palustris]GBF32684.1 phosphate regulon sensor protein PhoR [Desulfocucumis palustris]